MTPTPPYGKQDVFIDIEQDRLGFTDYYYGCYNHTVDEITTLYFVWLVTIATSLVYDITKGIIYYRLMRRYEVKTELLEKKLADLWLEHMGRN